MKTNVRSVIGKSKILSNFYFEGRTPIKIHGTLRVGSNYLKKLLELNFAGRVLKANEFGWKHGKLKYYPHFEYIIIARSPLSWVNSFWNWEKIHERTSCKDLSTFLSSGVTHPQLREEWKATNPIDAWNKTYASYINYFNRDNVAFVRFEDLISNFQQTIGEINTNINLDPKVDRFINYHKRADDWQKPNAQAKLDLSAYKKNKSEAQLDPQSINLLKENIDRELIKKMGYELNL